MPRNGFDNFFFSYSYGPATWVSMNTEFDVRLRRPRSSRRPPPAWRIFTPAPPPRPRRPPRPQYSHGSPQWLWIESALAAVRAAADSDTNLLHPMKDALAAGSTVGEVCGVLRAAWGTHDR